MTPATTCVRWQHFYSENIVCIKINLVNIHFVKLFFKDQFCEYLYLFSNNDQINTEPMVSQIGMLSVVEAPDILYNQVKREDNEKGDNISARYSLQRYLRQAIAG